MSVLNLWAKAAVVWRNTGKKWIESKIQAKLFSNTVHWDLTLHKWERFLQPQLTADAQWRCCKRKVRALTLADSKKGQNIDNNTLVNVQRMSQTKMQHTHKQKQKSSTIVILFVSLFSFFIIDSAPSVQLGAE